MERERLIVCRAMKAGLYNQHAPDMTNLPPDSSIATQRKFTGALMLTPQLAAPRRILVIRLQHHGDVLLATPIFSALKRHFPGIEVDVMVFAETAPMIQANPDLTHIWKLPRSKEAGRGMKRLQEQLKLIKQIRQRRYDWVLHMDDRWPGAWAALASGAKTRVSYRLPKRNNIVWNNIFPLQIPTAANGHVVERNLAFLRELGVPVETKDAQCHMAFSSADETLSRQVLSETGVSGDYILVHPTSRWFFKCWEDDRFAEVIQHLARDGHKIVLTAAPAPREMALIHNLLTLAAHPNIVSLAGKLTLPALAATISKAKLFIGVDSAPMHMAAALDVPVVALFGPTDAEAWRPWSDKSIVVNAADYGELIATCSVDTNTNERHLSNIPVQPVIEAIKTMLSHAT